MKPLLLTFTNLFPSSHRPTHGVFVKERMTRVAAALPEFEWQVIAPVPQAPWPLRRFCYQEWAPTPQVETFDGVVVHHPRFSHVPGWSVRRQAEAVARCAEPLVRQLAAGRRAVLDAHYLWPDGVAAHLLQRRLGLPFVVTARGSDILVLGQQRALRSRVAAAARAATARFGVSRALADAFADLVGMPRHAVALARNGVDLGRFSPGDPARARKALGLPVDRRLLLGVGRLVANKGFHHTARMLAELPSDVDLVLVGDGPMKAEIAALGGARVHLLGPQLPDQVALAMQAADLLVLPTEREGWPNVVSEALACGLRVVAFGVGGIPEILGNPPPADLSLGALPRAGDIAGFADAVRRTLAAPWSRAVVRAHAEQFGWDAPVSQLAQTFRGALAGGTQP